jgi:flavocytochrome c
MSETFNGVIVVGSGLSASSAAMTVIENGLPVMLIEKEKRLGGNSVKAWAGYNGANTKVQKEQGIKDSVDMFAKDTAFSGYKTHNLPPNPLQVILANNSGPGHAWLQDYGIKLTVLSQNGGHSAARTHRPTKGGAGSYITNSLLRKLKKNPKCTIINKSRVCDLLQDSQGRVNGVVYEDFPSGENRKYVRAPAVIFATGGFGGRSGKDSLLYRYRPDLVDLPTSNPGSASGDGMLIAEKVGAKLVDMEYVQVHPTGFIDPKNPNADHQTLATEALRGHGALLINQQGKRFVNEIYHRDWVSEAEKAQKGNIYLVMNSGVARETQVPFVKQYTALGLLEHYASGKEFCEAVNMPYNQFCDTLQVYNDMAARGYCPSGKILFPNAPFDPTDKYVVGIVTPLVHYVMGGILINEKAEAQHQKGHSIPGLYAAGETAGGIHCKNRLAGNSLVGCVVFGRVAGASAAQYAKSGLSLL